MVDHVIYIMIILFNVAPLDNGTHIIIVYMRFLFLKWIHPDLCNCLFF